MTVTSASACGLILDTSPPSVMSVILAVQVGRRQWERVLEMVRRIRALDMEVCMHAKLLAGRPSHELGTCARISAAK